MDLWKNSDHTNWNITIVREMMKTVRFSDDKSSEMERTNIVGLFSKQQKLNSSSFLSTNMSMMDMVEEEEETVMEAPRIGGRLSFLSRAARSSRSLLSNLAKQTSTKIQVKRRMVMGTRALEEGRRNRRLVCLCLPMVIKEELSLVVRMVAGGAIVEQVDSDSLLLRGDLILAVNGTLLAGKQVTEVEDLVTGQTFCKIEQTHLLNLILWRSQGF